MFIFKTFERLVSIIIITKGVHSQGDVSFNGRMGAFTGDVLFKGHYKEYQNPFQNHKLKVVCAIIH
jgi:hypothetical protein